MGISLTTISGAGVLALTLATIVAVPLLKVLTAVHSSANLAIIHVMVTNTA